MPAAAGSARSARPPSQSPLSAGRRPGRGLVELAERLGLGQHVALGPVGVARHEAPRGPPRRSRRSARPGRRHLGDRARAGWSAGRASTIVGRPEPRRRAWRPPSPRPTSARRPAGRRRSRPAARMNATTSAALSRNRVVALPVAGLAVPGRSTAMTRRPLRRQRWSDAPPAARRCDVTPWRSRSGSPSGSPQVSADHGMPAASHRDPASPGGGSSRAAATAMGRVSSVIARDGSKVPRTVRG